MTQLPLLVAAWLTAAPPTADTKPSAPSPTEYRDTRGTLVKLPLGDRSFVDEVADFTAGAPPVKDPRWGDPKLALGPPDYTYVTDVNYLTVGCGGSVVFRFVDNRVIDGPGPDIHVFEIGPDVEATTLALSEDGQTWDEVGEIKGGDSSVDLAGKVPEGKTYAWLRLTDLKTACSSSWPGADIDAVAAINSVLLLTLESAVLFDFDKDVLKEDAKDEIDWIEAQLAALPASDIQIVGHTDSVGSDTYNRDLSERRAKAVQDALVPRLAEAGHGFRVTGLGERAPIATNTTDDGRARNRRVEIVVRPRTPTAPPKGGD